MKKMIKVVYPEKQTINLAMRDGTNRVSQMKIGILILFAIVFSLFLKFGVADRLIAAYQAQTAYSDMKSEISLLRAQNVDYNSLKDEYSHYSTAYLTEEESVLQDRMNVLNLVENDVMKMAGVQEIAVENNTVTLTINNIRLSIVSQIVATLESEDVVDYVSVSTAATDTANVDQLVTANMVITLKAVEG